MKRLGGLSSLRSLAEQSGQALILVLIFLLLGSLTLIPVLSQLSTSLKTGVKYETRTKELYAADAGIEDGIWRIKYGGLQALFGEESYNYNFGSTASYDLANPVNGLSTNVTIENVWIPSNVTLDTLVPPLTSDQAMAMVESDKLTVSGTAGAVPGEPYHIMIQFTPGDTDNLTIKSVGVWLPQGFTYVDDSSTLEDDVFADYYPDSVSVTDHCGGQAIVWHYDDDASYPLFTDFPNFVSENGTLTSTIEFNYAPPSSDPTKMPSGIAWVTTEMTDSYGVPKTNDVPLSWDIDTRIYKITSIAGGTKVEAYSSKIELRDLNDAVAGDYVATGNSLMIGNVTKRDVLLSESSSDVTTIPADADVINAYLYWSGWKNETRKVTVFSDTCTNFDNWDRSSDSGNQTRVPTADGDTSGTWNTAPLWSQVDETTPDDSDYFTGSGSSGGHQLFTFSPFSVPSGALISNITVYFRARDDSSGTNNIHASIKVNGTEYDASTSQSPGSSFSTYSYVFTTNPNTSSPWTVDDVNGTGSNPLQQFGVYSSDMNPGVRVSMIYAEVNYGLWTISSNEFQGQGSSSATVAQRTLTLHSSVDLSSYTPGTVGLYWDQSESGTLEPDDTLYFAISGDGGSTWSDNIEVFSDDNPTGWFEYVIPAAYQTSNFKIRFYLDFDDPAEYAYLDNFKILNLPPDTSITFKINGEQVYLDGDGNPQSGAQPLEVGTSQVLFDDLFGGPTGFSFACSRDVTKLVKKYPVVEGEQHHTGNAEYTVGDVSADTGEYISYAGWSLIIIYFSPETAGHYLYLRDVFSYTPGGTNLDFDGDGQPGGDVTDFIIPEPIKNAQGEVIESVAASITCFVGEGDDIYTGDSLMITGQQSENSEYLSNSASPSNNVWNGQSPGCTNPGIDVDTFQVLWTDNILMPNDTRLHLDMNTGTDAWNLIYIILSVRSKTVIGSTGHYIISSN
jgi:hypothetical protein